MRELKLYFNFCVFLLIFFLNSCYDSKERSGYEQKFANGIINESSDSLCVSYSSERAINIPFLRKTCCYALKDSTNKQLMKAYGFNDMIDYNHPIWSKNGDKALTYTCKDDLIRVDIYYAASPDEFEFGSIVHRNDTIFLDWNGFKKVGTKRRSPTYNRLVYEIITPPKKEHGSYIIIAPRM